MDSVALESSGIRAEIDGSKDTLSCVASVFQDEVRGLVRHDQFSSVHLFRDALAIASFDDLSNAVATFKRDTSLLWHFGESSHSTCGERLEQARLVAFKNNVASISIDQFGARDVEAII